MSGWVPAVGEAVRDGPRMGEFRGPLFGRWVLRPLGGGRAWMADPTAVQPLSPAEALRARLAVENRRSSRGGL